MMKLTALILMNLLCTSLLTAHGLKCYQCDSNIAMVNCTKVQTVVTCASGVDQCCTLTETGQFLSGAIYKYFGKGCKGRKRQQPLAIISSFTTDCCGQSLCNSSGSSQASFVLLSSLILVSKIILI